MSRISKREVHLTDEQRETLRAFVSCGRKMAREITRARMLLLADEGKKDQEIVALLGISRPTVSSMRKRYSQRAFEYILDILRDAPRSGRPIQIDTRVEAKVAMIACSDPPQGRARWTLHMIADKLVRLGVVSSISHESVRMVLKKNA
jgi:putative transposase